MFLNTYEYILKPLTSDLGLTQIVQRLTSEGLGVQKPRNTGTYEVSLMEHLEDWKSEIIMNLSLVRMTERMW